ncbi:MAG: hypothetical protein AABM30_11100 [Actinomycetota bacterium]
MATTEPNGARSPSAAQDPPTGPVFSSDGDRRERVLRAVGRLVAVVVGIWLLALLAGAVGFGHLPGLPGAGLVDRATGREKAPAKTPPASPAAEDGSLATNITGSRGAQRPAGSPVSKRRTPAKPTHPGAQQPPRAPQVPPAVTPPSPGNPQGRAVRRHGVQPPAPPPPAQGNAKGQNVVNPGRLRKTLPPPPPPPPKKP